MRVTTPLGLEEHDLGDSLASAKLFPSVTRSGHSMIIGGLIPLLRRDVRELAMQKASFSSPNEVAPGSGLRLQLNTHGS